MAGDQEFERYLTDYSYHHIEFAPMELRPDMGDLKLILKVSGNILPTYQTMKMMLQPDAPAALYKNLKSPTLTLTEIATGQVVLTRDNWISTSTDTYSVGGAKFQATSTTQDTKGEGKTNGITDYNLGHVTVPVAGTYLLTGDHILFRKILGIELHNSRDFSVEVRAGAVDFDTRIVMILSGVLVVGAVICFLSRPPQLRQKRDYSR